ncbi:MAG: TIGR00730 family Rossman fold protein [Pseudomonadota bacterium]
MTTIKTLCVYCGSRPGNTPEFTDQAKKLGEIMASNGISLVYGAGTTGVMGAVASAVSQNGGQVTGIIPEFLLESEAAHEPEKWCSSVLVTRSMHERKQKMFEQSDGFVALPGGIGTLEEIIEIMTWAQLGRHSKPVALLNTNGFWNPLLGLYKQMQDFGFIHAEKNISLEILQKAEDLERLL